MKFFFDNNVPINIAEGLRALETNSSSIDIVHCCERWPPDGKIDDVDWIPEIASEGRIILTFDKLKNPLERKAYQDAHATLIVPQNFFYKKTYCQRVIWLVRRWPAIKKWVQDSARPGAFKVQQNGVISPG